MNRDAAIAHLLIDHGAAIGTDTLMAAARHSGVRVVDRLLDMGVPVDGKYYVPHADTCITALQNLCLMYSGKSVIAVEVLLRRGADPNAGVDVGGTVGAWMPFMGCCRWDNAVFAELLLKGGARLDARCEGMTVPEYAKWERTEMIAWLEGSAA